MSESNKIKIPIIVVTLIFVTTFGNVTAQSINKSDTQCPVVSVSCVGSNRCYEDPYLFRADVSGASADLKLSYEWTVIGGRIIRGQGTPQITVIGSRSRKAVIYRNGRSVEESVLDPYTATVKLTGVPAACVTKTTASLSLIIDRPRPVTIVEEFGRLNFQQLKPKLDNFAFALRNDPGAIGYIVSEGKWPLEKRAMVYLVESQKINPGRITYEERAKTKEPNVKLFLVPAGAVPPQ